MANLVVRTVAVGAVALAGSVASAQICTSLASFQAAIANDPGQYNNPCSTSGPNFSGGTPTMAYTVSAPGGLYQSASSGGFLGTNTNTDPYTVTFTSGNVYAVGGEWFFSNISDQFVPGLLVTLTYSDGTIDSYIPTSFNDFHGYVAAVPLTSVVMSVQPAGSTGAWAGTGSIITSSVPTPGAAAALGLGGLAGLRRRRR